MKLHKYIANTSIALSLLIIAATLAITLPISAPSKGMVFYTLIAKAMTFFNCFISLLPLISNAINKEQPQVKIADSCNQARTSLFHITMFFIAFIITSSVIYFTSTTMQGDILTAAKILLILFLLTALRLMLLYATYEITKRIFSAHE